MLQKLKSIIKKYSSTDKVIEGGQATYNSHFVPWAFAYQFSSGPILEMGSGHYSRPFLHALGLKEKRQLSITDTSKDWEMTFIDHRPGERRKVDIKRFSKSSAIVVVHDSQEPGYQYEGAFDLYRYGMDYKCFTTHSTLLSNEVNFDEITF